MTSGRSDCPRWRHCLSPCGIPAAFYNAYSQLTLGSYSVSNVARTIDNGELATRVGPLLISGPAIEYLIGMVPVAAVAAIGLWSNRRYGLIVGGVLAVFAVVLVLYPVTMYSRDMPWRDDDARAGVGLACECATAFLVVVAS